MEDRSNYGILAEVTRKRKRRGLKVVRPTSSGMRALEISEGFAVGNAEWIGKRRFVLVGDFRLIDLSAESTSPAWKFSPQNVSDRIF